MSSDLNLGLDPPNMAQARLRKAFRYMSEESSEDEPEAMDEEGRCLRCLQSPRPWELIIV